MGRKIQKKNEQEFISKFEKEAKSNKYKRGAKSYQNSNGKQNPIKIRTGSLIKIGAGSNILTKINGKQNPNKFRTEILIKIRAGSKIQ